MHIAARLDAELIPSILHTGLDRRTRALPHIGMDERSLGWRYPRWRVPKPTALGCTSTSAPNSTLPSKYDRPRRSELMKAGSKGEVWASSNSERMDYELKELIEPSLLQRLVDEIHQTLGVPACLVDTDNHLVSSSGWQDICATSDRAHSGAKLDCGEGNQHFGGHSDRTSPMFLNCPHGMTCAAVPIMMKHRHLASFVIGQAAANEVPPYGEETLQKHLSFVAILAHMLAQIGLGRLQVIETSQRLKQTEAVRLDLAAGRGLLVAPNFARSMAAISKLGELRDPYTAGHQRQVRDWACVISGRLGLDDADMIIGALIHDIGKIYVPIEILTKPGALSVEEFEILKEHPWYGYEIAKEMELSEAIQTMIYQHHERLDGSGYPLGLRGEEITLEARILAVADIVDSITSDRPYRPARPIDWAIDELETYRGIRYDARVVDACLGVIAEYGGATPPFEDHVLVSAFPARRPSGESG